MTLTHVKKNKVKIVINFMCTTFFSEIILFLKTKVIVK